MVCGSVSRHGIIDMGFMISTLQDVGSMLCSAGNHAAIARPIAKIAFEHAHSQYFWIPCWTLQQPSAHPRLSGKDSCISLSSPCS